MFWLQDYKLEFSEVSINYVYVMLICCPHNCCAHTCLSYCLSKSERQAGHSLRGGGLGCGCDTPENQLSKNEEFVSERKIFDKRTIELMETLQHCYLFILVLFYTVYTNTKACLTIDQTCQIYSLRVLLYNI